MLSEKQKLAFKDYNTEFNNIKTIPKKKNKTSIDESIDNIDVYDYIDESWDNYDNDFNSYVASEIKKGS